MTGGAFQLAGPAPVDQPLGLYRRGRVRNLAAGARAAAELADAIAGQHELKPIGLGARDSLRLEAGLPLYGHDLDRQTTPVEAGLAFAITKRRRAEGGFAGGTGSSPSSQTGRPQKRVGLDVEGRQPVREGALIVDGEGNEVGKVTSGGFSPCLEAPDRHGLCRAPRSPRPARRSTSRSAASCSTRRSPPMPFVPHRYHRKGAA